VANPGFRQKYTKHGKRKIAQSFVFKIRSEKVIILSNKAQKEYKKTNNQSKAILLY